MGSHGCGPEVRDAAARWRGIPERMRGRNPANPFRNRGATNPEPASGASRRGGEKPRGRNMTEGRQPLGRSTLSRVREWTPAGVSEEGRREPQERCLHGAQLSCVVGRAGLEAGASKARTRVRVPPDGLHGCPSGSRSDDESLISETRYGDEQARRSTSVYGWSMWQQCPHLCPTSGVALGMDCVAARYSGTTARA